MTRNYVLYFILISLSLLISGCSTRLGQFTAASTHNVRNLDYTTETKRPVKGDSCIHHVLFIPIGASDDRIQRAMDDAISTGQRRGTDGDLLVNARINHEAWSIGIYGQDCIEVTGDLVAVNSK